MWSDAEDHGENACVKDKAWGGLDLPLEVVGVEVVVGACSVEWKRRPGVVQDELVGSGGAQGDCEVARLNQRERGAQGSPELIAGVSSVCGGVMRNRGSLVAERASGVRGKVRGGEGIL